MLETHLGFSFWLSHYETNITRSLIGPYERLMPERAGGCYTTVRRDGSSVRWLLVWPVPRGEARVDKEGSWMYLRPPCYLYDPYEPRGLAYDHSTVDPRKYGLMEIVGCMLSASRCSSRTAYLGVLGFSSVPAIPPASHSGDAERDERRAENQGDRDSRAQRPGLVAQLDGMIPGGNRDGA